MLIAVHLGFDPSRSALWTVDQWIRMAAAARAIDNEKKKQGV